MDTMIIPDKKLLLPQEVAACFKTNPRNIYRWVKEGRLNAVKVAGRSIRIFRSDVEKILSETDNVAMFMKEQKAKNPTYLRLDPRSKMSHSVKNHINYALNRNGGERMKKHWEKILGYTRDDLMRHLEKQFKPGMSWENRKEWHIDHIKPVFLFKFKSVDDPEFKECWALSNLQPLWAQENRIKSKKYTEGG